MRPYTPRGAIERFSRCRDAFAGGARPGRMGSLRFVWVAY